MKIGFVMQPWDEVSAPHGGASSIPIVTYQLAQQLADQQHEVLICCRRGDKQPQSARDNHGIRFWRVNNSAEVLLDRVLKRIDSHDLSNPLRPYFASPVYGRYFIERIARQLAEERCDVIHLHNFAHFVPILKRHNPDAQIVLHMHCDWLAQLDIDQLRRQLKLADVILGCSNHVTCAIRRRFPEYAERCYTLHNGVDERFFRQPAEQPQADTLSVMYAGRLSPEKGVHVLMAAWNCVARQFPNATLTLIGAPGKVNRAFVMRLSDDPAIHELSRFYTGKHEYSDDLLSLLDADARAQLRMRNFMPHASLAEQFFKADLFVFPSIFNEPFGMPVAEAMAAGLPTVATRRGGINEIVADRQTGLLVAHNDIEALAHALCSLLADREKRLAFGRNGRQRAKQQFYWSTLGQQLEQYYLSAST